MQMLLQNFLRTVKDNYEYDIDKECKFIEFFYYLVAHVITY